MKAALATFVRCSLACSTSVNFFWIPGDRNRMTCFVLLTRIHESGTIFLLSFVRTSIRYLHSEGSVSPSWKGRVEQDGLLLRDLDELEPGFLENLATGLQLVFHLVFDRSEAILGVLQAPSYTSATSPSN